ncbi:LysR family transcriptional regulator [Saccharopolyspora sp. ASAGF58]|uniref:LysR family transcriptional regulator n=1 Tax=Saccharopolyspora sp. ASAGF58 TaxID=2719023 RepID=UPI00143FBB30|nr:LysR substrate-binding domain-containing protein [Saccharopolyspora sp. ASAGF58]QIZ37465.1 LysR family transcriptional regulator [Saccharopolyspora sp. ASAGF58]
MDVRRLRYFMVVADELHFGRAAERLRISQPPLSHQIRQLEAELGVELFHRTTRRVRLTPAGEELRRRLGGLLDALDDAVTDLHEVRAGRAGKLTVGFVSSASYSVMPLAVRRFRQELPGVELVLTPLTSGEQFDQLHDGTLDLGVVRGGDASTGLPLHDLYTEQLVACLPSDHRLASYAEVTPEELAGEPMISFPPREMPGFVAQLQLIFSSPVPFPRVTHRVVHQETALGFVAGGLGFTVLPESVSRFKPDAVQVVPISSRPTTTMMVAAPPEGSPAHAAGAAFQEYLRIAAHEALSGRAPGSPERSGQPSG